MDECLLLILTKRKAALSALGKIVTEFGRTNRVPDVLTILDYLTNMVYCVELMLKVLSDKWSTHNVGEMYKDAFGERHTNGDMMAEITTALRNQKYLFVPNGGLLLHVADLEKLHYDLRMKMLEKTSYFKVDIDIAAPANFLAFLRDNIVLFHPQTNVRIAPPSAIKLEAVQDHYPKNLVEDLKRIQKTFDEYIKSGQTLMFHKNETSII